MGLQLQNFIQTAKQKAKDAEFYQCEIILGIQHTVGSLRNMVEESSLWVLNPEDSQDPIQKVELVLS